MKGQVSMSSKSLVQVGWKAEQQLEALSWILCADHSDIKLFRSRRFEVYRRHRGSLLSYDITDRTTGCGCR